MNGNRPNNPSHSGGGHNPGKSSQGSAYQGGGGGSSYHNKPTSNTGGHTVPAATLPKITWVKPDGGIPEDLFSKTAEDCAKMIANAQKLQHNKSTQIRAFFDEMLRIESMTNKNEEKYKTQIPYLMMVRSKVYYSHGRDLVDQNFLNFIDQGLEHSRKGLKEFTTFCRFFEAFVGYLKFHKPK